VTKTKTKIIKQTTPLAEESQVYGKLHEGMHIAGYTFERACSYLEWLLKEDRWKLGCFTDVNAFLASLRMDEFQATVEQRKRIGKLIKDLQPDVSNRQIAKTVGISHTAVHRKPRGAKAPDGSEKTNQNKEVKPVSGAAAPPREYSGAWAAAVVARAERIKNRQLAVNDRVPRLLLMRAGWANSRLSMPIRLGTTISARTVVRPRTTIRPWVSRRYARCRSARSRTIKPCCSCGRRRRCFRWRLDVVEAWGFEYRTQIVWVKPSIGTGKFVRQRHELLLICRRGEHPAPNAQNLPNSVIEAPRGKHSEKPEVFLEIIERMYPDSKKIELFRRGQARSEWVAWGNEALEAVE
jgi:hypothetical protein